MLFDYLNQMSNIMFDSRTSMLWHYSGVVIGWLETFSCGHWHSIFTCQQTPWG